MNVVIFGILLWTHYSICKNEVMLSLDKMFLCWKYINSILCALTLKWILNNSRLIDGVKIMRTISEIFSEERQEKKGLKISLKKINRYKNGDRNNIRLYSLRKCRSKLGSSVLRYEILFNSTGVMDIPLQDKARCVVYSWSLETYCASCVRCREEGRCIQLS